MRLCLTFVFIFLSTPLFADPITYFCKYDRVATPDGLEATDNFDLTFVMDVEAEKFYMVGNNGTTEVSPVSGSEHLTFVEITAVGNVMTTTITNSGISVHSRNTVMFGDLIPSQYYGTGETR